MSELVIGGRTFRSRLFVGTGKFSSNELMARAIAASESEMVTVAMKRIDMNNPQDDMLAHVRRPEIQLLPLHSVKLLQSLLKYDSFPLSGSRRSAFWLLLHFVLIAVCSSFLSSYSNVKVQKLSHV